jgi:hypothetical protein
VCIILTGHTISTKIFPQPFTIHELSNGHHMPLAFLLLANKRQTSYKDVFRHTVSEAAKLGMNVFQTTVYADFKTAIHNAIPTVWPDCETNSCRFHLGQRWWLNIQFLGLSKQYRKKDSEVSQVLRKYSGRCF